MRLPSTLVEARLERRYKRFLADVRMPDGTRMTAHCPNTGAMTGCAEPGSRVWLTRSDNPARKYAYTWEMVEVDAGVRVGINTQRSNALVREAIEAGRLEPFVGYPTIQREVKVDGARLDFRLSAPDRDDCYVEVKNVTAAVQEGIALFPDAVSTRATRHLQTLMRLRREGHRAAVAFCVQREDVREVRPADEVDPAYGRAMRAAVAAGVGMYAFRARVGVDRICLDAELPVRCPEPGAPPAVV